MNAVDTSRPAIEVSELTRRYRRKTALNRVNLSVPEGCVFGLVGANGAGKTTLIKHILGALRPQTGQVRVLGMDPVTQAVDVLAHIGYLSEDREMPGWMRVAEVMRYTRAFFPDWDPDYADDLLDTFRLDPGAKIRHLSRGERALTGLLITLAHRPKVLVLDEPSSGLDPIVRRDILGAIIRTVAEEGRTVFFSSHLLDEVERVADHIAMIENGSVMLADKLDTIKDTHHRMVVRFAHEQHTPPVLDGALSISGAKQEWTLICDGQRDRIKAAVTRLDATIVDEATPTLEEIFIARAATRK